MKSLSFFSPTAASNLSNHFLPSSFSSVGSAQSLSLVQLFVKPWTAAHQVPLSITNTRSLLKLISIKSEMPSNHLIFCCPLYCLLGARLAAPTLEIRLEIKAERRGKSIMPVTTVFFMRGTKTFLETPVTLLFVSQ